MTEATDRLVLCQQMLGEIGTRSTITSLIPPDGSTEAFYCALFYNTTLQQVLRAAHWNFAGRTVPAILWKALPGTPENPTVPAGYTWQNRNPAPPWLYSYIYPTGGDAIQIRRVRAQTPADSFGGVPLFGGVTSFTNYNQLPSLQFEVASDVYDRVGNRLDLTQTIITATPVSAGAGYVPGDYVILIATNAMQYGQPATIRVLTVDVNGGVVTTEPADGGTFIGAVTLRQSSTSGNGIGFTCTATFTARDALERVILTNARNAILDITTGDVEVSAYDAGFQDAFMLAMEGKLALSLLGDKAMYKAKLEEANAAIINARVRDGNEGLTIQDHVPDWLQVRGVASMTPVDRYFPAYGPLFAV